MDCPRARRASRRGTTFTAQLHSSSARLAKTPATIRPVAFEVSIPSRRERSTIPRSAKLANGRHDLRSITPQAVDANDHDGVAFPRVAQQCRQTGSLLPCGRA